MVMCWGEVRFHFDRIKCLASNVAKARALCMGTGKAVTGIAPKVVDRALVVKNMP